MEYAEIDGANDDLAGGGGSNARAVSSFLICWLQLGRDDVIAEGLCVVVGHHITGKKKKRRSVTEI